MSDCFVLYLLLTCMKKKTSGADKFTNNKMVKVLFFYHKRKNEMSYKCKLVIAEKPSVAQSIAKVIGAYKREDGYL